jgi:homoserine O-acetyltransferase
LEFLKGQIRAIDPDQHCIFATDALGKGCSSFPNSSLEQPGIQLLRFTLVVMFLFHFRLLEVLGIEKIYSVIGASMKGMQVIQWAAN